MKITFPYMGTSALAFQYMVRQFGHQPVVFKPTNKTLSLGVKYAPEFACIPYKIIMGSYIEALDAGAEMIITSGGYGPCRAGEYGQLHARILRDMGYEFEMIVFESLSSHFRDFVRKVRRVAGPGPSWREIISIIWRSYNMIKCMEEIEQVSHWVRPRELNKGDTSDALEEALNLISQSTSMEEIKVAREEGERILRAVEHDPERPVLKVGIVGEIYVVIEPFSNLEMEEMLGEMGVEVERSIYLANWTKEHTILIPHKDEVKESARGYLDQMIGGHGQDSVGHAVLYSKEGFDGVIQLAPFTCIPEIVAKSIMPQVSREHDIPVLTFFLDEKTGKAGTQTRLEAFVDMLKKKREGLEVVS